MYWNYTDKERLFEAFKLTENNPVLFKKLFEDLFTKSEIETCIRRFKVMCLLKDLVPYSEITNTTGLSPNTIAKLSKIVTNKESGFRKVIEKFGRQGKSYWE